MHFVYLVLHILLSSAALHAAKEPFFLETFDDGDAWRSRWIMSENARVDNRGKVHKYEGRWDVAEPTVLFGGKPGDRALITLDGGKLYAIGTKFPESLDIQDAPLVLQYELKFQEGLECGGAYIRLMADDPAYDPKTFTINQPATLLFGPEHCGYFDRIHFAFRHRHPTTGAYELKHVIDPPKTIIEKLTSLYQLIVFPNNTFRMSVNQKVIREGDLLTDFNPSVNPPSEISDPNDLQPADWDDRANIPDPQAVKPADWDENVPAEIPDTTATRPKDWLPNEPLYLQNPSAQRPADWNDEENGQWTAPVIPNPACRAVSGCGPWRAPMKANPAYRGPWSAPLIPNPRYQGVWVPRRIPNPDTSRDDHPHRLGAVRGLAFEFWSSAAQMAFDNIYVGQDVAAANAYANSVWKVKRAREVALESAATGKKNTAEEVKESQPVEKKKTAVTAPRQPQKMTTDARLNAQQAVQQLWRQPSSDAVQQLLRRYVSDVRVSPSALWVYREVTLVLVAVTALLLFVVDVFVSGLLRVGQKKKTTKRATTTTTAVTPQKESAMAAKKAAEKRMTEESLKRNDSQKTPAVSGGKTKITATASKSPIENGSGGAKRTKKAVPSKTPSKSKNQ